MARRHLWWILAIAGCALAVRAPFLNQPLRYDEAHTYVKYVTLSIPLIVTRYDEPNNHIFHSIAAAVCTRVLGNRPPIIRLPALVAGVLTPVALFLASLFIQTLPAAFTGGMLAAAMPSLVFYSVNARGYTITCLLMIIAGSATLRLTHKNDAFAWLVVVASLSAAMWTVPTMVYGAIIVFAVTGMSAFSSGHRRQQMLNWLRAAGGTVAITAILYLPVALAYGPAHLTQFGSASRGHELVLLQSLAPVNQLLHWVFQGVPGWCQIVLVVAVAAGGWTVFRSRLMTPLVVGLTALLLTLLLQNIVPPERTWCFIVPFLCLAAASGLEWLTRLTVKPSLQTVTLCIAAVILSGSIGFRVFESGFVETSEETGYFPEGESVALYLAEQLQPTQAIIAVSPASAVLVYYAAPLGLPETHFAVPGRGQTDDSSALVVVDRRSGQNPSAVLTELQLTGLFHVDRATLMMSTGGADVYEVPGR